MPINAGRWAKLVELLIKYGPTLLEIFRSLSPESREQLIAMLPTEDQEPVRMAMQDAGAAQDEFPAAPAE